MFFLVSHQSNSEVCHSRTLLSITILSAQKLALFIQGSSNPDLYFVILVEVFVKYNRKHTFHELYRVNRTQNHGLKIWK